MTIRVRNSAVVALTASGDWSTTPTHGVLWANGVAVDSGPLTQVIVRPRQNDAITFPVGSMVFNNTIEDMNEAGVKEVFDAAVAAGSITWKVSLHNGDPGANYTANELTAVEAPGYTPGNTGRLTITPQVQTV